jgi:hypothetical protein
MKRRLIEIVRERASGRCEYCLVPDSGIVLKHVIDHIVSKQHGGSDDPENLALCCGQCNSHKGPNVAGIDPQTRTAILLFNPRVNIWREHFRAGADGIIQGISAVGRLTVEILAFNDGLRAVLRAQLAREGIWPS